MTLICEVIHCFHRAGVKVTGVLVISLLLSLTIVMASRASVHYNIRHWHLKEITVDQLNHFPAKIIFVDTRNQADYTSLHIPGAISLPLDDWDVGLVSFLDVWTPNSIVVVYCDAQSCGLSKEVALRLLKDLPEAKTFVLKGGLLAWQHYHSLIFERSNA